MFFWGIYTPLKLTWNLKFTQLKTKIIFQTSIFGFHGYFPGLYIFLIIYFLCILMLLIFVVRLESGNGGSYGFLSNGFKLNPSRR